MPALFHVDEMSLEAAASGAIWGPVWWELDSISFPEFKWNDLAVAFAVETLVGVRDVIAGTHCRQVRFFDGPFWVEFSRDQQGLFSIASSNGHSVTCDESEFAGVVRQIEAVAGRLLAECRERGWGAQRDVRSLDVLLMAAAGD